MEAWVNGWKRSVSSKSEAQLPRQLCSQDPLSSQKRTRENLGNKADGKRLPCDLLGMVWMPKSHVRSRD